MQFKFDANQEYQVKAVESAVNLFEGQLHISGAPVYLGMADSQGSFLPPEQRGQYLLAEIFPGTISNSFTLTEDDLLANLNKVQVASGLKPDSSLAHIEETIETATGQRKVRFPNFSIEMETGTGKTYVYLRTALELYRRYGLRKFIIVVPSVAIREGVLKTLEVTQSHLRELYDNVPYRYYVTPTAHSGSELRQR